MCRLTLKQKSKRDLQSLQLGPRARSSEPRLGAGSAATRALRARMMGALIFMVSMAVFEVIDVLRMLQYRWL